MAATPFPPNLFHSDTAQALMLSEPVTVPPSGDMELVVSGDVSTLGWGAIPSGQKMVVTVARGTADEKKYLVSSVDAGTYTSTLVVLAADREYDGLQPTAAPAGSPVEHTVSGVELGAINDHMGSRAGHGSDGDLVDEDSVQTLTNKTLTAPVITGLAAADANGEPVRYEQYLYVYGLAANALPKTGGSISGPLGMGSTIDMDNHKILKVAPGTDTGDAVAYEQVFIRNTQMIAGSQTVTTDSGGYFTLTIPGVTATGWAFVGMTTLAGFIGTLSYGTNSVTGRAADVNGSVRNTVQITVNYMVFKL